MTTIDEIEALNVRRATLGAEALAKLGVGP